MRRLGLFLLFVLQPKTLCYWITIWNWSGIPDQKNKNSKLLSCFLFRRVEVCRWDETTNVGGTVRVWMYRAETTQKKLHLPISTEIWEMDANTEQMRAEKADAYTANPIASVTSAKFQLRGNV